MKGRRDDRVRGIASQALLDRGWSKAKVATSGGETYIEALQAAAEVIRVREGLIKQAAQRDGFWVVVT